MAFIFSEDAIRDMYGMYQGALRAIQEQTQKVAEHITEIAMDLRYYPVVEVSRSAVDYYNEELKRSTIKAMETWQESEYSFSKIMDKMSAGDAAKNRSKELEHQIVSEIESWRTIDISALSSIDTTNWHCNAEDFQKITGIVSDFVSAMEDMLVEYGRNLEDKKEENTIYISIESVILQTLSIVKDGFKSGINESFSALSQEFESKEREAQSLAANAAQTVSSKTESLVNSGATALKAKVRKILE